MNPETKIPEAKNVSDINIHLGYISQGLQRLETDVKEVKGQIINLGTTFVTHLEFDPIKKQHEKNTVNIEELTEWKDGLMGKIYGAMFIIGAVWAVIGLLASHYWK